MRTCSRLLALLLLVLAAGCAQPEAGDEAIQTGDPSGETSSAVSLGGGGELCGSGICPSGEVCCNQSCGICAPAGAACSAFRCDAPKLGCVDDADCRAEVDQCDGHCQCDVLGVDQPGPSCTEGFGKCPRDPCLGRVPRCDRTTGACVMR